MDTFKIRIKQLRDDKELTQEQLAKILGVSRATLASWETGRREPDFLTAAKIADFFGVSVDYLFGRTSDPRTIEEIKQQPFDYSQLFNHKDEGQAYILAANLRYKYKLSDETFLKIIDEVARYYNRDQKPLDGGIAAHGPNVPGTGGFTKEELVSLFEDEDNKDD